MCHEDHSLRGVLLQSFVYLIVAEFERRTEGAGVASAHADEFVSVDDSLLHVHVDRDIADLLRHVPGIAVAGENINFGIDLGQKIHGILGCSHIGDVTQMDDEVDLVFFYLLVDPSERRTVLMEIGDQ